MDRLPSLSTYNIELPSDLIPAAIDEHIFCSIAELLISSTMLQAAAQAGISLPPLCSGLVKTILLSAKTLL